MARKDLPSGPDEAFRRASAEIARLRAALKPFADAFETVERETARLAVVNPKRDWRFASTGYHQVLADNIAPTWFRDAYKILHSE